MTNEEITTLRQTAATAANSLPACELKNLFADLLALIDELLDRQSSCGGPKPDERAAANRLLRIVEQHGWPLAVDAMDQAHELIRIAGPDPHGVTPDDVPF